MFQVQDTSIGTSFLRITVQLVPCHTRQVLPTTIYAEVGHAGHPRFTSRSTSFWLTRCVRYTWVTSFGLPLQLQTDRTVVRVAADYNEVVGQKSMIPLSDRCYSWEVTDSRCTGSNPRQATQRAAYITTGCLQQSHRSCSDGG